MIPHPCKLQRSPSPHPARSTSAGPTSSSGRLETVEAAELHKFARAFSLTLLGHLPTRPGTCPFCIQYDRDKSCTGCGYAATHGRCDAEDSAFSLFIEAFQELGRAIYQDTGELGCSPHDARMHLNLTIKVSRDVAMRLQEDLPSAGAQRLMELKACISRYNDLAYSGDCF